jgi:hypothetical protein
MRKRDGVAVDKQRASLCRVFACLRVRTGSFNRTAVCIVDVNNYDAVNTSQPLTLRCAHQVVRRARTNTLTDFIFNADVRACAVDVVCEWCEEGCVPVGVVMTHPSYFAIFVWG